MRPVTYTPPNERQAQSHRLLAGLMLALALVLVGAGTLGARALVHDKSQARFVPQQLGSSVFTGTSIPTGGVLVKTCPCTLLAFSAINETGFTSALEVYDTTTTPTVGAIPVWGTPITSSVIVQSGALPNQGVRLLNGAFLLFNTGGAAGFAAAQASTGSYQVVLQ